MPLHVRAGIKHVYHHTCQFLNDIFIYYLLCPYVIDVESQRYEYYVLQLWPEDCGNGSVMVAHSFNSSIWEAKASRSLWIKGQSSLYSKFQSGIHSETLFWNKQSLPCNAGDINMIKIYYICKWINTINYLINIHFIFFSFWFSYSKSKPGFLSMEEALGNVPQNFDSSNSELNNHVLIKFKVIWSFSKVTCLIFKGHTNVAFAFS